MEKKLIYNLNINKFGQKKCKKKFILNRLRNYNLKKFID